MRPDTRGYGQLLVDLHLMLTRWAYHRTWEVHSAWVCVGGGKVRMSLIFSQVEGGTNARLGDIHF